ncbi:hypothetical protein BDV29DRAFT_168603 [Aspergillus leporis]|uniref:MORN repeat protein n=1 Tax=Aspergillus leporis TaxID=41062 RepID=A0A5N5XCY8_9EURO|nr:hypothetical protein BDV29DRAFT_168603 [Aspergillus leporis]
MASLRTDMPWTTSGKSGKYTGSVNSMNRPDGQGKIQYNDGESYYEGGWKNGERAFNRSCIYPCICRTFYLLAMFPTTSCHA